MLRKVGAAPQVVVAVCEGAVLGGRFGLACVSDIAIAKADAKFSLPGALFNGEEALKFGWYTNALPTMPSCRSD